MTEHHIRTIGELSHGLHMRNEENLTDLNYLTMVVDVLTRGVYRPNRTGVGSYAVFGYMLRFPVVAGFPLLTTKRVHTRSVIHELLWMLRGSTDVKELHAEKVTIWDEWARSPKLSLGDRIALWRTGNYGVCNPHQANDTHEDLDKLGVPDREEGDWSIGRAYGAQWRNWYSADFSGVPVGARPVGYVEVDQIAELVKGLRENPFGRRHIVTAWNPGELPYMGLPPCHCLWQCHVSPADPASEDQRLGLTLQLYQRSCDIGLGVPFNIAAYALLLRMIAHVCNMRPLEFVHTYGDLHVYENHVEPLIQQLSRPAMAPAELVIRRGREIKELWDFRFGDFDISYESHPAIPMPVAV